MDNHENNKKYRKIQDRENEYGKRTTIDCKRVGGWVLSPKYN